MRNNKQKNDRSNSGSGNRYNNTDFRRNNFSRGPRQKHKTICAECQKECEVPFKPTEGKPVYCRECFDKRKRI